jgi:lysophospholipase L1-like esterase
MVGKLRRTLLLVRDAWLVLGVTLLFLLFVELALSFAYVVKDRMEASSRQDYRTQADAYAGASWVNAYWRELDECRRDQWASYVYWRRKPYQGRYVNIDANGLRRTWTCDENRRKTDDPLTIFTFGGSTMWSVGARDDFTIASCLAKKLDQMGIESEVTNFGEFGYVSTQEVIALLRQLQRRNIPDLVVFYDGVNDVYSTYQQQAAGLPHSEFHRVQEFNLSQPTRYGSLGSLFLRRTAHELSLVRLSRNALRRVGTPAPADGDVTYRNAAENSITGKDVLFRDLLAVYEGNMRMVEALGQSYGFQVLFYWQPTVFQKKHLTAYEEAERDKVSAMEPFFRKAYELVGQGDLAVQHDGVFHDVSGMLSDARQPIFIDWCHVSEAANELMAERMAADTAGLFGSKRMTGGHVSVQP